MEIKKLTVFIKAGYHINTTESGKTHTFYVSKRLDLDPYEYALYQLPSDHNYNPNGYMVAVPSMMEGIIPYKQVWKIEARPETLSRVIRLYATYAYKSVIWFILSRVKRSQIEREKLMRLSGLMDKSETLYFKYSPHKVKLLLALRNKESQLRDPTFFI
jgi:hypothetical protein